MSWYRNYKGQWKEIIEASFYQDVKFDWVNSYQDFIGKFGVKDSNSVLLEVETPHNSTEVAQAYVNKLSQE